MKPNRQTAIYSFILMATFIWIGFVCSISFMEAWLKFQAPHVSLPIGLSIGRLVFAALNKVEWTLAGIIILSAILDNQKPKLAKPIFLYIPIVILILQTFWLLPSLNERAEKIIQGVDLAPSFIHFSYLFLDFVKVFSLFALGLCAISRSTYSIKSL